jgi:hypothetical protein
LAAPKSKQAATSASLTLLGKSLVTGLSFQ